MNLPNDEDTYYFTDKDAQDKIDALGTASTKNVPTSGDAGNNEVVLGNDTRLTDARPASDVPAWAKESTKPSYTKSEVGLGNVDNTSDSTKKTNFTGSIASGNTGFVTGGDAYTALGGKADKVSGATNGNLAGLDANGNLTDSGVAASEIPALWKSQGEYGVKNLIPYPYIQSTKTQNGITFTSYSDGSVLVNGTATNDANFEVLRKSDDSLGGYWMTGGKSNGLLMRQRIVAKTGGTYIRDKRDTGSGILLDNIDASTEMYYILVYVMNGTSVNNETVYPMIRLAADTDDTYRPYAKTNKQLTDEVAENIEDIDTINDKLADMPYFKVVNGAIAIVTEE